MKDFDLMKAELDKKVDECCEKAKSKKGRCWEGYKPVPGKKPYSEGSCVKKSEDEEYYIEKATDKPFHGYNKKRHSPTGGLNAKFREKYNREHGSNLKAPVTEKKPTGKRAARRRSFCARMSGMPGPTSKDGKHTPKGAALKRWRCSMPEDSDLTKSMEEVYEQMNTLTDNFIAENKGE